MDQELVNEKDWPIYQDYEILGHRQKTAFGETIRVLHKQTNNTRLLSVVQKINKGNAKIKRLIKQVEMVKQLHHPNIQKIYDLYQDTQNLYIVSGFCTGGELHDKIIEETKFSEQKAAETLKQIMSAVNYLQKNKMVHRDLKPEEMNYESNEADALLKIVNFETIAIFTPNVKMSEKLGTPYFIAPEVLENKYDEKCDIWSCGVILFILLSGTPPFLGDTDIDILETVKTGNYSFDAPEWTDISNEAKNLIKKMLERDPKKRISAEEVLSDEWINK